MAIVQTTNIKYFQPNDFEYFVRQLKWNALYFERFFPYRQRLDLTYRAMEHSTGLRVAADIVARGSSYLEKTRDGVSVMSGTIPKIATKRSMDDNALNELYIALNSPDNNATRTTILDSITNDVRFCYEGIGNRLEEMALQIISTGKYNLVEEDNGVKTNTPLDYQLESWQKLGSSIQWENEETAKPFDDFEEIIKAAEKRGISLKYLFINKQTFAKMCRIKSVIQRCSSYLQNIANIAYMPSLEQVNMALAQAPNLNGLQLVVIDQQITKEDTLGKRVTKNPFEENVCMFSESLYLGNTFWMQPIDMTIDTSTSYKAMNGIVCVKQFGQNEPLKQTTSATANAIPVWSESGRALLLKTNNTSWDL